MLPHVIFCFCFRSGSQEKKAKVVVPTSEDKRKTIAEPRDLKKHPRDDDAASRKESRPDEKSRLY